MDLVFDLAKKKPWIREECGWIVYRCIYELSAQKADAKFVETALERLCSNDLAKTPEGVSIWLAAKELFPSVSFPSKVWKHDDPLDARERNSLTKVMKESSSSDSEDGNAAKSSGVWNSKLHFAWEAVISKFSAAPAKEKSKSKGDGSSRLSFIDFWTEVVDSEFSPLSSSLDHFLTVDQTACLLLLRRRNASIGASCSSTSSLTKLPCTWLLKFSPRTLLDAS